jgi:tetratricopeptide (TPR) repeat protein
VSPAPIPPSHAVRLAIGWLGLPEETQNLQVADLAAAELTGAKGLELVDRQSLKTVLRELELSLSGLVRAKDAVRVGKLLRAEWFLLGTGGTTSNANPYIVARIVDARTGIMRDVRVFTTGKELTGLATDLAGFARQCREGASFSKPRTFLAVGTLADVGINRRQAEFPQQLRAYLTRAYQPSQVTLLEREQVSTLLQEVRLDLAGLTDDPHTSAPQPLQSAFWLVNGFFQSFETSGYEVEVVLSVNRIFGRTTNFTFRGQPGEPLLGKIKDAIDRTITQASPSIVAPTRSSEFRQQIEVGRDLLNTGSGTLDLAFNPSPRGPPLLPEQDFTKRRAYLTEAVRALETALLLEPESRQARFYLSACYCDEAMGRYDEGLGYLRELAGSLPDDQWSEKARVALAWLYDRTDRREAARWFNEAASHTTNAQAASGYRSLAQQTLGYAIEAESAAQGGVKSNAESGAILEARLFADLQSARDVFKGIKGNNGILGCSFGLGRFVDAFGTNQEAAARRLIELLPTLTQEFPELTPHLLCSVACFQVDTNAPVIAEFRKSLAACAEHPEQMLGSASYFEILLHYPYVWCMDRKLYALAAELVEAKRHASVRRPDIPFDERDKVRLAFAYLRLESWRQALVVLEELGDVSIVMQADGPWGAAWTPFVPARQAVLCREKLGLAPVVKAGHFIMDRPCLCLHTPSTFVASTDGVWVAIGAQLLQLGFDLRTNKVVNLPISSFAGITALCLGPDQFWIGTAGEGLIEFDKGSGKCRLMTEKDGLLINHISSLCLHDKTLWIGFGREQAGGFGSLDLLSGRLSACTPPLLMNSLDAVGSETDGAPPRHAVTGLTVGAPGELWMLVTSRGLCRYRIAPKLWDTDTFGNGVWLRCFGVKGDTLIGGFSLAQVRLTIRNGRGAGNTNPVATTDRVVTYEERAQLQTDPGMRGRIAGSASGDLPHKQELRLRQFGGGRWETISQGATFPEPPNVLQLDGSDVWLGGRGYIAAFDLNQNKIRASCSIAAKSVDRLQVAGGYLWAQFDKHLYKAPLSAMR